MVSFMDVRDFHIAEGLVIFRKNINQKYMLIKQINQMIYKLYDFTQKLIIIIENKK